MSLSKLKSTISYQIGWGDKKRATQKKQCDVKKIVVLFKDTSTDPVRSLNIYTKDWLEGSGVYMVTFGSVYNLSNNQ